MTAQMARSMISAEFLKLRRRRGVFWWSLVLACGSMVVGYAVMVGLHIGNPGKYGPAGGADNFGQSIEALAGLAGIASIMIGATAGAGDLGAGVFRDMVTTGRSRLSLFLVRVPGALMLQVPMVLGGFAIATIGSFVFAGGLPTPDAGLIVHYALWLLASTAFDLVLALAVAALLGSRATTVGVVLGWEVIGSRLLQSFGFLGNIRDALNVTAMDQLRPGGERVVSMPVAVALVVLAVWVVALLTAGAWRTRTIDA